MAGQSYRAFLTGFFAALGFALGSLGLFNYIVDPFHYYRGLTAINHVFFSGFQRHLNVGLARNFQYDTVVVGSSVTENFLPSFIDRSWGGKAVKLSVSGSTSYEQFLILRQAIDTGQVRRVIWALDIASHSRGARQVRDDQGPFPHFMYRHPGMLNLEYPLSLSTFNLSVRVLKGWGETDLDELDTWNKRFQFGEAAVLAGWPGRCDLFARKYVPGRAELPVRTWQNMRDSVRSNVVAPVRAFPNIVFYLFFPPMATLIYVPADSGLLSHALALRSLVARDLGHEPNVRLFDFQPIAALTDDLSRYKDMLHFDLATTEYVIDAMRDGRWRVDEQMLITNNDRLTDQVNHYDLCSGGGPIAARGLDERTALVPRRE